jgi:hypothetical protein
LLQAWAAHRLAPAGAGPAPGGRRLHGSSRSWARPIGRGLSPCVRRCRMPHP